MDTLKTLTQQQAIDLVRRYKNFISPRFDDGLKVYLYGSYSKGYARPESDIDVAVVVPTIKNWLRQATDITLDAMRISGLIEPVLMEENEPSPLYRDVMRTGIAV